MRRFALRPTRHIYRLVFSAMVSKASTILAKAISTAKATIPWIAAGVKFIGSSDWLARYMEAAAAISAHTAIPRKSIRFSNSQWTSGGHYL
ncbi:hypothetical protein [Sinisalibacter aestuarii]|uniref:hypothetical protein n=1 Tax=Sinisalibacter aestuarii TaxID=2949426 RepID=UPI00249174AC|nr:hypothetical protein [Sinisalibacter aestuarii]